MADPLRSATDQVTVYQDRQLTVVRTIRPYGLRFVGEVDIDNSESFSSAVSQFLDGLPDLHCDLRQLVFCDVSGIRALVTIAEALGPDRRLVLHGIPPDLERVISLVGWSDQAGLTFCDCTELEG